MRHYQFNIRFTRPDENNEREYYIGYNVSSKFVNTIEQAENYVRESFSHLTILSIELFDYSENGGI